MSSSLPPERLTQYQLPHAVSEKKLAYAIMRVRVSAHHDALTYLQYINLTYRADPIPTVQQKSHHIAP